MSGRHRRGTLSIVGGAQMNQGVASYRRAHSAATRSTRHQITMVEAVAYTMLIVFVAIIALGWFDLMIPWRD